MDSDRTIKEEILLFRVTFDHLINRILFGCGDRRKNWLKPKIKLTISFLSFPNRWCTWKNSINANKKGFWFSFMNILIVFWCVIVCSIKICHCLVLRRFKYSFWLSINVFFKIIFLTQMYYYSNNSLISDNEIKHRFECKINFKWS